MIERGLVLDGRVLDVPGSELVHRDTEAWWSWDVEADRPDMRRRLGPCTALGGHWTAGHPRTGPEAARRLVAAMKARRKDDDGDSIIDPDDPLADVSVHFGVSWDGVIYQLMDLRFASVHMSRRVNQVSLGVETMSPGSAKQARKLKVEGRTEMRRFGTRRLECLVPSPEMISAYVELARMVSTPEIRAASRGLIAIDRTFAGPTGPVRGHLEHYQAPSSKNDAADYLNDALRSAGWR